MAKAKQPVDDTIIVLHKEMKDLKELLEYQDKVLGTADKLLKTKDNLIDILEYQKEAYISENKMLTAALIGCVSVFIIIGIVKVISLIL